MGKLSSSEVRKLSELRARKLSELRAWNGDEDLDDDAASVADKDDDED